MSDTLRCLIISDLHAIEGGKHENDSYLSFTDGNCEFSDEFLKYVKSLNKEISVLICPGDIGNKADKKSFSTGLTFLHDVRKKLKIKNLLLIPGNHDYSSKDKDTLDPKSYIQFIAPRFPSSAYNNSTHFWAWHWCHIEKKDFNAIILDTSAYHGYKKKELEHGRVLHETSDRIFEYLNSKKFQERGINFLVCHHNPYRIEVIPEEEDNQIIDGGEYLLQKITRCTKGPWIVIHGHRHLPNISYSNSGTLESAVVFSAGTMAAKLPTQYSKYARNQFYIFEIDLYKTKERGIPVGVYEAYEYAPVLGWRPSSTVNFPHKGGFGAKITPHELSSKILTDIKALKIIRNENLEKYLGYMKYFMPKDILKLEEILKKQKVHFVRNGLKLEEIVLND